MVVVHFILKKVDENRYSPKCHQLPITEGKNYKL